MVENMEEFLDKSADEIENILLKLGVPNDLVALHAYIVFLQTINMLDSYTDDELEIMCNQAIVKMNKIADSYKILHN